MERVVGAPTPTDVKGKTEEILLTIVEEDIILPQNNRQPNPIGLTKMLQRMERVVEAPTPTDVKGKTEEILLTIVGEDIILPPKQPQTEPKPSVENVTTNGADSRGRLSLQMLRDTPKKFS